MSAAPLIRAGKILNANAGDAFALGYVTPRRYFARLRQLADTIRNASVVTVRRTRTSSRPRTRSTRTGRRTAARDPGDPDPEPAPAGPRSSEARAADPGNAVKVTMRDQQEARRRRGW